MFLLFLITLILLFLFSWGSAALAGFSRHDLETLCTRQGELEKLRVILKEHQRVETAFKTLVAIAAAAVLATSFGLWETDSLKNLLDNTFLNNDIVLIGLTLLFLIFLDAAILIVIPLWIAPPLARISAEEVVFYGWKFWQTAAILVRPLDLCGSFFAAIIYRLAGIPQIETDEEAFEEEIRTIVTEGHREGHIEEDAREMIEGVMELSDATVSEIMTPRTDMKSLPSSLSWSEMLAEVISVSYTRIPIYGENRDDIIGILIAKDLLPELAKTDLSTRCAWTDLLKEPIYVPETKPVNQLLQEFQQSSGVESAALRPHSHLAIVLDEYGGVSGLVTLEDVLEEIVGEIVDEHDPLVNTEEIVALTDGGFEVMGRVHIDELNEHLHWSLPEDEDYDTFAGYIFSTLGRIPKVGESLEVEASEQHYQVTIIAATPRRIERVAIRKMESL